MPAATKLAATAAAAALLGALSAVAQPPGAPPPPLPAAKYKVVLAEHNPLPALSHSNAKGKGASPCPTTFNPSYVEVAGENKVGGIVVRTDSCNATKGSMSWAPCDVMTGVCGDLVESYQYPHSQGTEDPRIIYNKYDQYFYNFAYGENRAQSAADGCASSGLPGAPGACTVVLSRTKTPAVAATWAHVPGGTYPWHRNGCCHLNPAGQKVRPHSPAQPPPAPAPTQPGPAAAPCSVGYAFDPEPLPPPPCLDAAAGQTYALNTELLMAADPPGSCRATVSSARVGRRARGAGSGLPTRPTSRRASSPRSTGQLACPGLAAPAGGWRRSVPSSRRSSWRPGPTWCSSVRARPTLCKPGGCSARSVSLSLSVSLSVSPVPRPNPSPPAQHASEPTLPRVGMHAGSGDLLHFYAAATPGWVPNGNYTAGYIILDKDEPTKIIQRGSGQFMIPTFEYETLCDGKAGCAYGGERRNVIFLCSATKIGPDKFRLFFGGGDGNVGTGVVQVSAL
jgi:hypothetical protein